MRRSVPGLWIASFLASIVGASFVLVARQSPPPPTPVLLAAGASHSLAIDATGSVWGWGANIGGQVGDGSTATRSAPVAVSTLPGAFTSVAAGGAHSLALRSDGAVFAWGLNTSGEIGDGSTSRRLLPVPVASLTGIVALAAGAQHSLALRANGTVAAWGANSQGQLGDNTTTRRLVPVTVSGLGNVVAIAAGGQHSLALKADGTVWAWGANGSSQLGDNTTTRRRVPVRVATLPSAQAIAAGGLHSVAVLQTGVVMAWGGNLTGAVGDGSTVTRRVPVAVPGLTNVIGVSAGASHSTAVSASGGHWAWGANLGALGDGSTTTRLSPVPITPPAGAVRLAAGGAHSLAQTTDGSIWSTGVNLLGPLGNGTTASSTLYGPISGPGQVWGVTAPVFSPAGGTFALPQAVVVTTLTPGAQIRYTTDGSVPTTASPTVVSGAQIPVVQVTTLRARAFKTGMTASPVTAATYTLQVATPSIAPGTGTYGAPPSVTLATASPGATLYYTLDGSDPTTASTPYTAPFAVPAPGTLRVRGFRTNWIPSTVATATYTFNFGTLATPTATPPAGSYASAQTVTLTADAGATIHYTLDGSDPTPGALVYAAPLTVAATTTLKAQAYQSGYAPSAVLTALYAIDTTGGLPPGEPPPPDPVTIAPPLSQVELTPFHEQVSFLYNSPTPIQHGLLPGTLQDFRVAVLRGRVLTRDGQPLPGARVRIADRPEFGYTVTRLDGMFDLAVNGGGPVTLEYTRNGFLPVQRVVDPPWHDYAWAPDVRMVQLDTNVTTADFSVTAPAQVVRGSVQTDASGTRQATLIVPEGGVMASMTLPDGTVLPNLATLALRATEYTVGAGGLQAMPAPLPPSTAYTYAVELSADEALASNATALTFSPPLPFYVENFLNFPVGFPVPVGTYDRTLAAWLPEDNGIVIRVLAPDAQGRAGVDIDGTGIPADAPALAALGVTDGERQRLATLYAPGQSLWRAPIAHFSPFDLNQSERVVQYLQGEVIPLFPPPLDLRTDRQEDRACKTPGSVIECQNQTLGEDLPVAGTPFSLVYRSNRAEGRVAARTVEFSVTGAAPGTSLLGAAATVTVGGRTFTQSFGTAANQQAAFTWDGLDAYGRRVVGNAPVTVRVAYDYEAEYVTNMVNRAFSIPGGTLATGVVTRIPQQLSTAAASELRGLTPAGFGANGWSLDVHHHYDVAGAMLRLGTGDLRQASASVPIVEAAPAVGQSAVVAADGSGPVIDSEGYRRRLPQGGDQLVSSTPPIGTAYTSVAVGPDEALYYAGAEAINELTFNRLYVGRYAPDGQHTVLADIPLGQPGECPIVVSFYYTNVAVAPDRTVYASLGSCLYRVLPDGQRYRMRDGRIGASAGYTGLAVGPDGTLYVSDADVTGSQIFKLVPTGDWEVVAGTGLIGPSADGVPATSVPIDSRGIAIDRSGVLYFQDQSVDATTGAPAFRIRKVGPAGIVSPVAGGANLPVRDGWPASASDVSAEDIAVGPDDALYLSGGRRITGVAPRRTQGPVAYQFPSDDGAEIFDFDDDGRHLRTRDALTGVTLFEFAYDPEGRLIRIRDREGLDTIIERTAGVPTAIVSPFGPRTTLSVDANRDLRTVTDPESQAHGFDYVDGLMTRMTDATGAQYAFSYTPGGRLETDGDPEGGTQVLARASTADGWTVTRTQSEIGATTYLTERPGTGGFRSVTTGPDGTTASSRTTLDGRTVATAPDGTVTAVTVAPDSRFGLQAPVVESAIVRTPAGLEQVTAQTRDVFLADPDDLASVQFAMDTTTVNGRTFTSQYEPASGTITSTSPEGRQTVTTLDALGRPSSVQVGDLAPTSFHYDAQGRLHQRMQGARTTTFGYDSRGYLDAVTDPLTRTVSFTNDAIGRALTQTFPDSRTATFRFDGNSNLRGLTPPGRPEHSFDYTGVNMLETYTPPTAPGTGPTGYSYDTARRPRVVTRADGQTLTFAYETGTGRLESLTTPTGATTYGYESGTGRLATVTSPGASLSYAYDGSLLLSETWSGSAQGAVTWAYDNNFRITNETVRNAFSVTFGYDNDGLLMSAGNTAYTRFAATGLLESSTVGSVATSFGYNGFGELTSHATTVGGTPAYAATLGRDAGGRIQQQAEVLGGVTTTDVYGYDAAGRLETVTRNGTLAVTYGYDANGNRNAVTTAGGSVSATFDNQDRILTFGTRTYAHTPHGDVAGWTDSATSTTTTVTYDVQGNLRQFTQPGTTVTYTVDGRNRRIGTAVNGVPLQGFLWQGQLRPVAELDGGGALVSRFVYGTRINVPEYMERGGTTYRLVTDHLGSVRLVIDTTTNTVVQALTYDPWGVVLQDTNPGFQPFGYAGGLYDHRTGLVRFGVRDYDAVIGRWLAKDPIGFAGGDFGIYTYVADEPTDAVDPTGRDLLSSSANVAAGFGDFITSGAGVGKLLGLRSATEYVRDLRGWDVVDKCSWGYFGGELAGSALVSLAAPVGSLNGGARSVFYTGYPKAFEAAAGAGVRLSDTLGGRVLNYLGVQNGKIVDLASAVFASNAKGEAKVFIHGAEAAKSVWMRIEQPLLKWWGNASVTKIAVP